MLSKEEIESQLATFKAPVDNIISGGIQAIESDSVLLSKGMLWFIDNTNSKWLLSFVRSLQSLFARNNIIYHFQTYTLTKVLGTNKLDLVVTNELGVVLYKKTITVPFVLDAFVFEYVNGILFLQNEA